MLGLLAATGLAAACGDSTGPAHHYDPYETLDRLESVLRPFGENEDLLLALDLAVGTLDYYGAGALAAVAAPRPQRGQPVLTTLRAAVNAPHRVSAPGPTDGSSGVRSADPIVGGATTAAPGAAFLLPNSLRGRTLAWDPVDGYVITGRGGGPADGVRFLLYRMDTYTGYPDTPLAELGWVDLVPEGADRVRVRAVRTAGPDRELADYRVSLSGAGSYSEGEMELRSEGWLGDGAVVELDLLERLTWSASTDRDELLLDYDLDRNGRSVRLRGEADSRYEAYDWARFSFDLAFRGHGARVDLEADVEEDGRLRGEIRDDGRIAVRIRGYDGSPRFERADGRSMGWGELEALEDIWTGISDLVVWMDWVLLPQELLAG